MEKHIPRTETRYDDLAGVVSLNFREDFDFYEFAKNVADVDLDLYEPISVRVFAHNGIVITVYALDKARYRQHRATTGRLLVRKFKVEVSPVQLAQYVRQIDCTLVNGEYDVEDFEVIN